MKAHSINSRALGTNSLTNAIMASSKPLEPKVGMGATILHYTDRTAVTITAVRPKVIETIDDKAKRTDKNGISESQDYSYTRGNTGWKLWSQRKNGAWVKVGEPLNGGTRLAIGTRDHYIDPSF